MRLKALALADRGGRLTLLWSRRAAPCHAVLIRWAGVYDPNRRDKMILRRTAHVWSPGTKWLARLFTSLHINEGALREGLLVSQGSVAREFTVRDADALDAVLIDFKVGRARQALRNATAHLHEMLVRLNARPGAGINFALIFEIVSAEQGVAEAREVLRRIDPSSIE
jgi:hypothetical protein